VRDLADLGHDQQATPGSSQTRFANGVCPDPKPCAFVGGVCTVCDRREGTGPETDTLLAVAEWMEGGMPMDWDTLSADQWAILGTVRQWVRLSTTGGLNG
jgi:hypothetical protein